MAKEKAGQHVIPKCYLKAWCDPGSPVNQTPYIWRFPRAGGEPRRKSPEKSFVSNDRYTILLKNGDRDLRVEKTLGELESRFVRVRSRIVKHDRLDFAQRLDLCLFVTAMHTRTIAMGDHWAGFHEQRLNQVLALEQKHHLEPTASREIKEYLQISRQEFVITNLKVQTPLLLPLNQSIFVTDDKVGFTTSDTPCVWHDPQAYKRPPGQRYPALMWPTLEITLPLTPSHLLVLSRQKMPPYVQVAKKFVDELNRRTRFYCTEEFVSRSNVADPLWFEDGAIPADAWENTDEGKASIARHEKEREWRERYEAERLPLTKDAPTKVCS